MKIHQRHTANRQNLTPLQVIQDGSRDLKWELRVAQVQAAGAMELHQRTRARLYHDRLTRLFTRDAVQDYLEILARYMSGMGELTVMLFDLDRFKSKNDRYGHPKGDVLLSQVGSRTIDAVDMVQELLLSQAEARVASVTRTDGASRNGELAGLAKVLAEKGLPLDIVFRFGGEEMGIILPSNAVPAVERIMRTLCDGLYDLGDEIVLSQTVSMGVSVFGKSELQRIFTLPADQWLAALVSSPDLALYVAKEEGRARANYMDPDSGATKETASQFAEPLFVYHPVSEEGIIVPQPRLPVIIPNRRYARVRDLYNVNRGAMKPAGVLDLAG